MRLAGLLLIASVMVSGSIAFGQEVIPRPADVERQRRSLTEWKSVPVEEGVGVQVKPSPEITLTFPEVTKKGALTYRILFDGPKPPAGYLVGAPPVYLELNAGFEFKGPVDLCVTFAPQFYPDDGSDMRVLRRQEKTWVDETRTLDRDRYAVCAQLPKFGLLLLAVRSVSGLYDDLVATVRLITSEELQQDLAAPILESRDAALRGDRSVFEERVKTVRELLAQAPPEKVGEQTRAWLDYFLNRIEARVLKPTKDVTTAPPAK
jgi:hypothetical protein